MRFNIFEKAMWCIKVTKTLLEDVEIKEPHWNEQLGENTWPMTVPPPAAGPGNAVLDEAKSIPQMLTFGVSMFDKVERQKILEALSNIDWGTIKNMIKETANRYDPDVSSPEQITYQATYDGTTITIIILTGGGELIKKIIEIKDNLGVLKRIEWPDVDLPYDKAQKLGADAASNPQLADALAGNVDLVDAWKKLDDAGADALRTNPNWLNRVKQWTDDGLNLTSEGKILNNGSEVGKIVDNKLHVNYSGYGGEVICDPNKTTTVLGRFNDGNAGTSVIKDSKLYKYGEDTGGVNMLDEPNWTWDKNEEWLTAAANRNDVIRVVTDPTNNANIWVNGTVGGTRTTFGREVELLENLGYTYNSSTFQFIK
jgi:hypothetical protein